MLLRSLVDLLIKVLCTFRFHGIIMEASKLIFAGSPHVSTMPYVSSRRLSLLPRPPQPGRPDLSLKMYVLPSTAIVVGEMS